MSDGTEHRNSSSNNDQLIDYASRVSKTISSIGAGFQKFCEITEPSKLDIAKNLIQQQGIIDLEIEGFRSRDCQRDLSIKFHWGHNHRFSNDVFVKGRMQDRHITLIAEFMVGFNLTEQHFHGKDAIDVGCWTGGTTLMLKYLGADNILALEEVQKYALTAKRLVCEVYELGGVTCDGTNLYELETDSRFDIAYFPGVIYHLSDPVLGLRRLFNCLKVGGECFVESAGINSEQSIARFDGNRVFHQHEAENAADLNRGGWNWFIPSPLCLGRWMVEAGFTEVASYFSQVTGRVFAYGRRQEYVDFTRAGFSRPEIE